MVSLSRSFNAASGGATFFCESQRMEDTELLAPDLEFRPLKTVCATSLHLIFTVGLEITAIVLAICRPDEKYKCQSYFYLLYIHVALWVVTLLVDNYLRFKHHELRMNGYLDFYNKLYNHHRLPFYIVSLWNASLLFLQTIMQHLYPDNFAEYCLKSGWLTPLNSLLAVITVEVCILFGISSSYIVKVRQFNKQCPLPDVQREEWTACSTSEGFAQGEVGYQPNRGRVHDFIEKQADLIRYLKEHNNRLNEKLMILNAQVSAHQDRNQRRSRN